MTAAPRGRVRVTDKQLVKLTTRELLASDDFRQLVARRWRVALVLTLVLFVVYYGFILLVATERSLLATRVGEVTTLGIVLGVAVLVLAWVLTAAYVVWANRPYIPKCSGCATACATSHVLHLKPDGNFARQPDRLSDRLLSRDRRAHARDHLLGCSTDALDGGFLCRWAQHQSATERSRPRWRLHERGLVPWHCRTGGAERF